MLDNKIILIGYSGHAISVADIALEQGYSIIGYSEVKQVTSNPFNLIYFGDEGSEEFEGWKDDYSYILGIGDNNLREKIVKIIQNKNKKILSIIHPSSMISSRSNIDYGTFISRNVTVNINSTIGKHTILNTGCVIEHDCVVKDYAHIGPGAVLAGNVKIGERSFVGANAVIKQGIEIGDDVIIGAGTVVIKNVEKNKIVVGNPSREI